jgi:hypothetical protein
MLHVKGRSKKYAITKTTTTLLGKKIIYLSLILIVIPSHGWDTTINKTGSFKILPVF